jgi:hypothetical protein
MEEAAMTRASTRPRPSAAFAVLLSMCALALGAWPARAHGAIVTRGAIGAFAASSDEGIAGVATMVGTADGRTLVTVAVRGPAPDTSYGGHVHRQACAYGFGGGGHHRHDPAEPASPPNELWPTIVTNPAGIGVGSDAAAWTARPEAMSVVVHAPGGARIACADLE